MKELYVLFPLLEPQGLWSWFPPFILVSQQFINLLSKGVYFSLSYLLTLLRMFLFHHWSWDWHSFIVSWIKGFPLKLVPKTHIDSTTSLQLSSLIHIDLNRNLCFRWQANLLLLGYKINRQWSKVDIDLCCTFASGNRSIHSLFATILSNLINVRSSPSLQLHQVKCGLEKPRSARPQASKESQKANILLTSLSNQPLFSSKWVISLNSPKTTHGRLK